MVYDVGSKFIETRDLGTQRVDTKLNIADILTKPLASQRFEDLVTLMKVQLAADVVPLFWLYNLAATRHAFTSIWFPAPRRTQTNRRSNYPAQANSHQQPADNLAQNIYPSFFSHFSLFSPSSRHVRNVLRHFGRCFLSILSLPLLHWKALPVQRRTKPRACKAV
ncbi:hypothetical protein LZ30DRAFT_734797 [Colletotrichum cereale]|nr:hypothetical protein LZ30DRAFT_734797 [Colletotrichum cereale]